MRRINVFVVLILALLWVSSTSTLSFADDGSNDAAAGGKVKTKFYNFDDMLIDGAIKRPSGTLIDVRDKVKFDRLLKLKKSLLPTLEKTAKEKALK